MLFFTSCCVPCNDDVARALTRTYLEKPAEPQQRPAKALKNGGVPGKAGHYTHRHRLSIPKLRLGQ